MCSSCKPTLSINTILYDDHALTLLRCCVYHLSCRQQQLLTQAYNCKTIKQSKAHMASNSGIQDNESFYQQKLVAAHVTLNGVVPYILLLCCCFVLLLQYQSNFSPHTPQATPPKHTEPSTQHCKLANSCNACYKFVNHSRGSVLFPQE
jgi:cytochrome c-type biogenesis protein CcmH/NrfG